ncbi:MAG: hypothetical protein NTW59_05110, partial [Candidatus Diapherotrites archaeon]|nr:hypothetical protein [Candidatus Diapherotrites archaeon]
MPPDFRNKTIADKIFIVIIIAAVAVRLFAIAFMPELQLTDTVYHLQLTKFVATHHSLPVPGEAPQYFGDVPVPVPLYYFATALPFALLPIPFNLAVVKIFPLLFSALQLLLAFLLLRRLFPKHWLAGLAFVAVHPMLIIYGSVNYTETLASVCVLLCFFVYWRFMQTGKNRFIIIMPFVLAATALSKLSATIVVPAFFAMFLAGIIKWQDPAQKIEAKKTKSSPSNRNNFFGKKAKIAFFVFASLLLCSVWFIADYLHTGTIFSSNEVDIASLLAA